MARPPTPTPTLDKLQPMLLYEGKTIPRDVGWRYEVKLEGYRVLASTGGEPRLKSHNGTNATTWFPELVAALADLPAGNILDGEVCVLDDGGRSDLDRLHARAAREGWYNGADLVVYCIFDLLVSKGKDLRSQPLERRKAALRKLMVRPAPELVFVDSVEDGAWLYAHALAQGMHGVVAKRAGSLYRSGERSRDWIKIKGPEAVPTEK